MSRSVNYAQGPSHPCPRCGEQVPAGADRCPSCGQPLCPECGATVGEHWSNCVACGAKRDLFCPECGGVVKPRDRICPHCGVSLEAGLDRKPALPRAAPQPSTPAPTLGQRAPACAVCGRQDETLRLVVFPYVFSVVVMTSRQAFSGVWCRKHRNRYWVLSSLITSLAGWFGFPFGLIYTPLTLLKLAQGGEQPLGQNQHLLQVLARHKLRAGDTAGAIRCLEEALRLGDDGASQRRLLNLYKKHPLSSQEPNPRLWPLFVAILGAVTLGITIGLLDYAIMSGFSILFGEGSSILLTILSWTPWVTLIFLGGLGIGQIVEWALRRTSCRQKELGLALAVVLALVALYGTQQGAAIADYVWWLLYGEPTNGFLYNLFLGWFTLTTGGALWLADQVASGNASGTIYLVLFVVATVYYLTTSVRAANGIVRWQQTLATIRARGKPAQARILQRGWLAIGAVFVCLTCSLVSLPILGTATFITENAVRMKQIADLHEQGQVDQAVAELEALVAENPDLVIVRSSLGASYAMRGQFEQARRELEIATNLQPESGVPHALLATVYYFLDETDLAKQELRQAEELGQDDETTQIVLGHAYQYMRRFAEAEDHYRKATELDPEDAEAQQGLARAYAAQGKYEQALATCNRALELAEDPTDAYVTLGHVHIQREDLDAAWAAFSAAREATPGDASAHAGLSRVHFLRGEVAKSLQEAEEAVRLDPYNRLAQENVALARHALGDLDLALEAAQEAVRLNPQADTAYYVLGLCYRDSDQRDKAVQAFETFLDLYWDRAYVREWKAEAEAYLMEQK